MRWNNCDEYWKNGNSLFKRRFHCRHRPRILRSLMTLVYARITRLRMSRSIFSTRAAITTGSRCKTDSTLTWFSIFTLFWESLLSCFIKDILSAYHFKLALHASQYHVGEVHWSYYTESLITSMPYRWQHPADTKIQTAHFVKKMPSSAARTPNRYG